MQKTSTDYTEIAGEVEKVESGKLVFLTADLRRLFLFMSMIDARLASVRVGLGRVGSFLTSEFLN